MEEKNTLRLLTLNKRLFSVVMAQWYEAALFVIEEVGVHIQIPAGQLTVFFLFYFFFHLVFTLWLVSIYSNC